MNNLEITQALDALSSNTRENLRKMAIGHPQDSLKLLGGCKTVLERSGLWDRITGFPDDVLPVVLECFSISEADRINPYVARLDALTLQSLYVFYRVAEHPFQPHELTGTESQGSLSPVRHRLRVEKYLLDKPQGKRSKYFVVPGALEVWPQWRQDNLDKLEKAISTWAPQNWDPSQLTNCGYKELSQLHKTIWNRYLLPYEQDHILALGENRSNVFEFNKMVERYLRVQMSEGVA